MRDLATRKVHHMLMVEPFCPVLMLLQVVMTQAMLQEAWDGLRGAVTIAYPQGLPEYDEV